MRAATEPRNITLTFAKNGFYKTLKNRVRAEMPKIDRTPIQRNNVLSDFKFDSLFNIRVYIF